MLAVRGKYFATHLQTWFWLLATGVLAWIIGLRGWPFYFHLFGRSIIIDSDCLPAVITLYAIIVTTVWSGAFLFLRVEKAGLLDGTGWRQILFRALAIFSFLVSLVLSYYYFAAASDTARSTPDALIAVAKVAGPVANAFRAFHLVFFIGVYALVDLLVSQASKEGTDKALFASVFWFIDCPIFLTMLFVTTVVEHVLDERSFYIFEAGVLSFQLVAGSLAVVGLEYLENEVVAAVNAKTKPKGSRRKARSAPAPS